MISTARIATSSCSDSLFAVAIESTIAGAPAGGAARWRDDGYYTPEALGTFARESQERPVIALRAARQGTFVWHPLEDRGEPDAQMLSLFGLPENATLTLEAALSTLIHPDNREAYAQAVACALELTGDGILRHDLRIDMPDGRERWVDISAQTEFALDPPRGVRMAGVATDVSERKRVEAREAEVRREQQRSEFERHALARRFQQSLLPRFDIQLAGVAVSSFYLFARDAAGLSVFL